VLLMGEIGGKLLYHPPGAKLPDKYHLLIKFEDDSALSATTQMWGAYELYEAGQEQERQYVKGMRPTPLDEAFTQQYFSKLIDELLAGEKRSVKSLLTQDQLIPGLGNSIAQDILFQARLNPRRPLSELNNQQRVNLYAAILDAVHTVIELGGRYDETDLFGKSGGYVRRIDSKSAGRACTECGSTIEKMQYLGGACYFCPSCQE
jgi:formamidopyrimidine-DNA glycosylase